MSSYSWSLFWGGFPKIGVPFLAAPLRDSILFGVLNGGASGNTHNVRVQG